MDEKNEGAMFGDREGHDGKIHALDRPAKHFTQMDADEKQAYALGMSKYGASIMRTGIMDKLIAVFKEAGFCPCAAGDVSLMFAGLLNSYHGGVVNAGDMEFIALGASLGEATAVMNQLEDMGLLDKLIGSEQDDPFKDVPKGNMH